jgi:nicotinate phosphoribosyltransferase
MSKYNPSINLLEGIRNLFPLELCPWDDYYMRMAQSDFLLNRHKLKASKSFFIRKAPFNGSYALLGGLTAFLRVLKDYRFDTDVADALKDQGYQEEFVKYLCIEHDHLDVSVYALPEGSIFFPNEPAIVIEGGLLDVRIAEGILLREVNYPTLSMTKWSRVAQAARPGNAMEFARRRAQDPLRTSLYAYLGGAALTSNAEIRRGIEIPVKGTMGHEWVQSFGSEIDAFDKWLEINPDRPVLLVDTIDTLKSGLPNAIKALKIHWDRIKEAKGVPGIRNDSGDLAYITIEERLALDAAGLFDVLIFETNDLDEYSIEAIKEQIFTHAPRAGLDSKDTLRRTVWACGTQPGTCADQPSIGGVAKLSSIEWCGEERAVIKIAKDNPIKTSIPGSNRSAWVRHIETNELVCCLIYGKQEDYRAIRSACHPEDESKRFSFLEAEDFEIIQRQRLVYQNATILENPTTIDVRSLVNKELESLHWTHRRFESPHTIKVSLSPDVFALRKKLIFKNQLMDK